MIFIFGKLNKNFVIRKWNILLNVNVGGLIGELVRGVSIGVSIGFSIG